MSKHIFKLHGRTIEFRNDTFCLDCGCNEKNPVDCIEQQAINKTHKWTVCKDKICGNIFFQCSKCGVIDLVGPPVFPFNHNTCQEIIMERALK